LAKPGATKGTEAEAQELDRRDELGRLRREFLIPPWPGGRYAEYGYLAGNSLGLQPAAARESLDEELGRWAQSGVEAWFEGDRAWLEATEELSDPLARLAGARPHEVVTMSSLTVNLHLLLASFYRPSPERWRILVEEAAFPSDAYAVQSQAAWHGLDPSEAILRAPLDQIEAVLESHGSSVAVALLPGVSYLTGEALDVQRLTAAAHVAGAVAAWDLAHAIGNVPLELHEWGVDFAVWCTYKYLNAGPGAPGGAFVHERHSRDRSRPRLAGWWGTDPAERFRMDPDFVPQPGAHGFAASTPSILGLAPLRASLELFDRIGFARLRERSLQLTGYLEDRLDELAVVRLITPREPGARGCQLSVSVAGARDLAARLRDEHGVICDFREPDVLRFAPVPLSNNFHDCWRAAAALGEILGP
jgi:kynureninase